MRLSHIPYVPLTIAITAFAAPLSLASAPPPAPAATANGSARVTPAPAQVRLEMHLTRLDKEGAPGAEGTPPAAAPIPPAIASPTLSTLDRGTATVSVTNADLAYSISASPAVEQTDKATSTVQVLWNVRLSGRSLPGGTNAVTTTGATRIDPVDENESLLTELPIADAKTGHITVFRLTARVIVTKADSSGPRVRPVPGAAPAAP